MPRHVSSSLTGWTESMDARTQCMLTGTRRQVHCSEGTSLPPIGTFSVQARNVPCALAATIHWVQTGVSQDASVCAARAPSD
jgi:hypothetical protein